MKCRFCNENLSLTLVDLGSAPPSNAYLNRQDLSKPEIYYPLRVMVCESCWLVQTEDYAAPDHLFSDSYAYFSSTSKSWLDHAHKYCAEITSRLGLGPKSFVVEIASNDGYLLRNFHAAGIPCLGIEPTDSTAAAAEALGISTRREFFGRALAERLARDDQKADLIIGNNVFAHVPEINDFTSGMAALLKTGGTITLEFPHLLQLMQHRQFDTIYHEHFSYFALQTVNRIFESHGLRIFDVEELATHGGSLRVYGCHKADPHQASPAVQSVIAKELSFGLQKRETYAGFQSSVETIKNGLLEFLLTVKREGETVVGYGAAAKGNTLLNFAGVKPDLLPFICDAAPSKQGKFMPGSHIPILAPEALKTAQADYVLILPWNIREEIMSQLASFKDHGTVFVTAVPELVRN